MTADRAVFAADCDTREIADMLIGTGELVEEGGLAAVLVAHEGEGQKSIVRKRIAVSGLMEASGLAETGMFGLWAEGSFFTLGVFLPFVCVGSILICGARIGGRSAAVVSGQSAVPFTHGFGSCL